MIDINFLRTDKGHNPDLVFENQKKRFCSTEAVTSTMDADSAWRKAQGDADTIRMNINANQRIITDKKKASKGQDLCEEEMKVKAQLEEELKVQQEKVKELESILNKNLRKVANWLHESVPISDNEEDNLVVRTWGEPNKMEINGKPGSANHWDVLEWIGGVDLERGTKVAGHRGYFLKGPAFLLNQALITFGTTFLAKRGYTPIQPPFFMKQECVAKIAQLSDFDETLYKVKKSNDDKDEESYYLIATSEMPIASMHQDEWFSPGELPIRYAGYSSCFRKEAGAYGKDTKGIFRIHQFEKVEQFVICDPDESWQMQEEMIEAAEEFYKALNLPYQVISIVSGALNDAAARKYDLEAWFPGYNTFRELVSCSNCLDYQSRSAEIRYRKKDDTKEKNYVHMLNATLTATERTICCILENYQTETGVKVPEVLVPFVGTDFIPYTKLPVEKETKKQTKETKE